MTLMALHGALSPQITHSKRQENPIASLFPALRTATPKEGDGPANKLARVGVLRGSGDNGVLRAKFWKHAMAPNFRKVLDVNTIAF